MITDYASLQTAIRGYLDDSNLPDADVQRCIQFFEAEVDRDLRTGDQSNRTPVEGTDEEYYTFLAGSLGLRAINVDGYPLKYETPAQIDQRVAREQLQNPAYYTIIGRDVRIVGAPKAESSPGAGDAAVIQPIYYDRLPKLSDTVTSNWLLEQAPDMYLYGSLEHAELFVYDVERFQVMMSKLKQIKDSYIAADVRDRWSGAPKVIRLG